jgi:hypothetical protein
MLRSCDTMVAMGEAAGKGQTLFAKNSDRPPEECQPLVQRAAGGAGDMAARWLATALVLGLRAGVRLANYISSSVALVQRSSDSSALAIAPGLSALLTVRRLPAVPAPR